MKLDLFNTDMGEVPIFKRLPNDISHGEKVFVSELTANDIYHLEDKGVLALSKPFISGLQNGDIIFSEDCKLPDFSTAFPNATSLIGLFWRMDFKYPLDLSHWDFNGIKDFSNMFRNCNVSYVIFDNTSLVNLSDFSDMFALTNKKSLAPISVSLAQTIILPDLHNKLLEYQSEDLITIMHTPIVISDKAHEHVVNLGARTYYQTLVNYEFGEVLTCPDPKDWDWDKVETYFLGHALVKPPWMDLDEARDACETFDKDYILEEVIGYVEVYHYTAKDNVASILANGIDKTKLSEYSSFCSGLYFYASPIADEDEDEDEDGYQLENIFEDPEDLVCLVAEHNGRIFRCIHSCCDDGKDNPSRYEYYMFEGIESLEFEVYTPED